MVPVFCAVILLAAVGKEARGAVFGRSPGTVTGPAVPGPAAPDSASTAAE
jgi:hypothetical protein